MTQKKSLGAIRACRTSALGGHVLRCLDCGQEEIAYNSCRNRNCPKCQALVRARWLEREAAHLLPVDYHHVVFTLPREIADLGLSHPSLVYGLLFQSASGALRAVSANPKHLGAEVGTLMVLHTWGQNLHHHPHVHCVVTGGGLSCDARGVIDASPRWISCRRGFFLPVRELSRVFREHYLRGLRSAWERGELSLSRGSLEETLTAVCHKDWVVYSKPPFGNVGQTLKYLARYTHRVAISNHRLLKLEEGRVTFEIKDYADGHRSKTLTISAEEFLRRFVQHVLPSNFVKMRHYGLLANRSRQEKLALSRKLLSAVLLTQPCQQVGEIGPAQERTCRRCGGVRLAKVAEIEAEGRGRAQRSIPFFADGS